MDRGEVLTAGNGTVVVVEESGRQAQYQEMPSASSNSTGQNQAEVVQLEVGEQVMLEDGTMAIVAVTDTEEHLLVPIEQQQDETVRQPRVVWSAFNNNNDDAPLETLQVVPPKNIHSRLIPCDPSDQNGNDMQFDLMDDMDDLGAIAATSSGQNWNQITHVSQVFSDEMDDANVQNYLEETVITEENTVKKSTASKSSPVTKRHKSQLQYFSIEDRPMCPKCNVWGTIHHQKNGAKFYNRWRCRTRLCQKYLGLSNEDDYKKWRDMGFGKRGISLAYITDHLAPGSPPSFPLAPGTERSQGGVAALHTATVTPLSPNTPNNAAPNQPQESSTVVLIYTTDSPELPVQHNGAEGGNVAGNWEKPLQKVRCSEVTQHGLSLKAVKTEMIRVRNLKKFMVFHLPSVERRHVARSANQDFGESQEQQECNKIASNTGTKIELSESRDQSLTIVLTGKRTNVEEARKLVIHGLQTQASRELRIPNEHHRAIIGREGKRLQDIERETDCRIQVPNRDSPADSIRIIGPKEGIEKAMYTIQLIYDEQSKLAQEHLAVPRIFYPWIRGPNNCELERIVQETGAKVNIPPPSVNSGIIVITGENEGVYKAAAEIKNIYEEKKALCKTATCQVSRVQHRSIIGPGRAGLAEILRETGVSVEVPPEDENSDTITLRGDPDKLGQALSLVYAKASSVISSVVPCPTWLHKFIIGQRGAGIKQLTGDNKNVNIVLEDDGQIYLDGDPKEVKAIEAKLIEMTAHLKSEMDTQDSEQEEYVVVQQLGYEYT